MKRKQSRRSRSKSKKSVGSKPKDLTRRKALAIDTDFYVDEEDGQLYVFGGSTGFAYKYVQDKEEGEEIVKNLYEVKRKS